MKMTLAIHTHKKRVCKREIKARIDQDLAQKLRDFCESRNVAVGAVLERALDHYFIAQEGLKNKPARL